VKTGLQNRLRAAQRDRVAPDTGPMTGSSNYQQPSTIRGEAHPHSIKFRSDRCTRSYMPFVRGVSCWPERRRSVRVFGGCPSTDVL